MGIKAIKCRTTTFWHPCCSHVLIWCTWTQQCWETRLPASEGENVWGACERIIIDLLFQLCMFYCFTSLNQRRFHVFFASTKLRPFKYKIHVCTSIKPLIDLAPFAAFTGFVQDYKTVGALSVVLSWVNKYLSGPVTNSQSGIISGLWHGQKRSVFTLTLKSQSSTFSGTQTLFWY